MIYFNCEACGKENNAPEEYLNKLVSCSKCKKPTRISPKSQEKYALKNGNVPLNLLVLVIFILMLSNAYLFIKKGAPSEEKISQESERKSETILLSEHQKQLTKLDAFRRVLEEEREDLKNTNKKMLAKVDELKDELEKIKKENARLEKRDLLLNKIEEERLAKTVSEKEAKEEATKKEEEKSKKLEALLVKLKSLGKKCQACEGKGVFLWEPIPGRKNYLGCHFCNQRGSQEKDAVLISSESLYKKYKENWQDYWRLSQAYFGQGIKVILYGEILDLGVSKDKDGRSKTWVLLKGEGSFAGFKCHVIQQTVDDLSKLERGENVAVYTTLFTSGKLGGAHINLEGCHVLFLKK